MTYITLRWAQWKMCLLGTCGGGCVDESHNWWISFFKASSFSDKSCSFLSNLIKKTKCNLAYYFSWIKHRFERCAFRAAYTTNFGRNRSVLQENCKSRLYKICVLVHPRGSCLQRNAKKPWYSVSIEWNSVTLMETTAIVAERRAFTTADKIPFSLW